MHSSSGTHPGISCRARAPPARPFRGLAAVAPVDEYPSYLGSCCFSGTNLCAKYCCGKITTGTVISESVAHIVRKIIISFSITISCISNQFPFCCGKNSHKRVLSKQKERLLVCSYVFATITPRQICRTKLLPTAQITAPFMGLGNR
jgi:hypothetical protein